MASTLSAHHLAKAYGGRPVVKDVSLQVSAGEIVGLLGPNGAGKTTFMDIVTGKTRPDTGVVKWGDKSVDLLSSDEAQIAQAGVGRKFQKPTVFEDQTVFENLLLALKNHRNVFRVLFYKRRKSDHQKVVDLARDISLDNELQRLAGELSHGQKQWLEIGMLLAQDPKLLLVDEPAAGMTATEREKTTAMLVKAAKTRAVVVVEHDMEFVRRLDCKVTVLHEGAVLAEGRLDHVTANQDVLDVYLGR